MKPNQAIILFALAIVLSVAPGYESRCPHHRRHQRHRQNEDCDLLQELCRTSEYKGACAMLTDLFPSESEPFALDMG